MKFQIKLYDDIIHSEVLLYNVLSGMAILNSVSAYKPQHRRYVMDVNEGVQRIAEIFGDSSMTLPCGSSLRGFGDSSGGVLDDVVAIEGDDVTERAHVESIFWSNELFYCSEYGGEVRAGDCIEGDLCGMCGVCEWRSYFLSGAQKREARRGNSRGGGHANKAKSLDHKGKKVQGAVKPKGKFGRGAQKVSPEGKSRNGEIKTTLRRGVDVSKYGRLITNESKGATGRALGTEDKISFGKQILYIGVGAVNRYGLSKTRFIRFWTEASEDTNVCEVAFEFLYEYKEGAFKLSTVHTSSENLPAFKVSSAGLRRALVECGYEVGNVTGHCGIVGSSVEKDGKWLIVEIGSS